MMNQQRDNRHRKQNRKRKIAADFLITQTFSGKQSNCNNPRFYVL